MMLQVEKVSRTTDLGSFDRADPAQAKVVELVGDQFRRPCFLQVGENDVLHRTRLGCNADGVPELHEEWLKVARQPRDLGVRIRHREQSILDGDALAFGYGSDFERELACMFSDDVLPAFTIEDRRVLKVLGKERIGFVNIFEGDRELSKVGLEEVLKTEEGCLIKRTSSALEKGEGVRHLRRILLVMRGLVAIGEKNGIVSHSR